MRVSTRPARSAPTQKPSAVHDTAVRPPTPTSITAGADQDEPSNAVARPAASTATQDVAEAPEPRSGRRPPRRSHAARTTRIRSRSSARPLPSTATQNVALGHETDDTAPPPACIGLCTDQIGRDHEVPFPVQRVAVAWSRPRRNRADEHDTDVRMPGDRVDVRDPGPAGPGRSVSALPLPSTAGAEERGRAEHQFQHAGPRIRVAARRAAIAGRVRRLIRAADGGG